MKLVNNAFSSKIVKQDGLAAVHHIITEDEFMTETHKSDVVSCIGHEDTAKLFNLEFNRQSIELHEGDILFVCELNNPNGTRLPAGITEISQLPDGFHFRFLKLECVKL